MLINYLFFGIRQLIKGDHMIVINPKEHVTVFLKLRPRIFIVLIRTNITQDMGIIHAETQKHMLLIVVFKMGRRV